MLRKTGTHFILECTGMTRIGSLPYARGFSVFSFSLSFVLLYYFILLYFANTLSDVTLQKSAIHRQGLSTQSVANESTITSLSESSTFFVSPTRADFL